MPATQWLVKIYLIKTYVIQGKCLYLLLSRIIIAHFLKSLALLFGPHINVKMGFLGAFLMASLAFYLNADFGFLPAMVPAFKQFIYTFFVGGILVRLVERLSLSSPKRIYAYIRAIGIPTLVTSILITFLHLMKGTPNPASTIFFTAMAAPPGFAFVAIITRKKNKSHE